MAVRSRPSPAVAIVPGRRTTLADVARACRVSLSAASQALNHGHGHCEIAAATCERIQRAAASLGYAPRWQGHARVHASSRLHALILRPTGFFNAFNVRVLDGFCAEAARQGRGVALVLATSGDRTLAERLAAGRFDGAVLVNGPSRPVLQAVRDAGLRTVLLNAADLEGSFLAGCDHVAVDDARAVGLAHAHCIGLGHRRIAFLARPRQRVMHGSETLRPHAFAACQAAAGCTGGETDDITGLVRRVRTVATAPTAVVCYNDAVALRLLQACHAAGVHVPGRLSVVGIDDNPAAAWAAPALTAIAIPAEELGRAAARMLIRPADGGTRRELVTPQLVVRASTAAPHT